MMVSIKYKENKALYSTLVHIAVPIALQGLITSSLNLVDNIMIGQLGEAEFSAVGMANQLFFVFTSLLFGFTSGAGAYIAQFWGIKDLINIKKVLGFSLFFTILSSTIFFLGSFFFPDKVILLFSKDPAVIRYGEEYLTIVSFTFILMAITISHAAVLKITEQTKLPMKISAYAFLINTVLNYVLIFGKLGFEPMGVKGAAIGTLISRLFEMVLILYFIYIKGNIVRGKISDLFSFSSDFAKRILKTAFPVVANEVLWGLGMASYGVIYGHMGTTEYAALQVSNTVHFIFIMAIFSIGDAALVMIGKDLGRKSEASAYDVACKLLKIGIVSGILSGIFLIIFSPLIVKLFNFTPEGRQYATVILSIYGCFMWLKLFSGINIIGVFRGGGDTKFAMYTEVATVWLVGVPLVFFSALVLKLPLYLVVIAATFEEIIKGIICYKRLKSKKWINNIIHSM
jgi:putative MATE family efflux protein